MGLYCFAGAKVEIFLLECNYFKEKFHIFAMENIWEYELLYGKAYGRADVLFYWWFSVLFNPYGIDY